MNIEKGIVKIIDNFKYNNTEYIVMEKIEGNSLKEIIMSKNEMKLQEIMDIFLDLNSEGKTIIMATHDANIVNKMKKRVVTFNDRKVMSDVENWKYNLRQ